MSQKKRCGNCAMFLPISKHGGGICLRPRIPYVAPLYRNEPYFLDSCSNWVRPSYYSGVPMVKERIAVVV